ncbi:hypothetical protein FWC63_00685 [Candidatus Saccharibacteria bacterium]|nr:hypothetical protein [Candidatus Saccharibacteria bacterium]
MTQKGLVRCLTAALVGACFFAGLSVATSIAMFARVEPTLVSPFGLIVRGAPDMLVWISFAIASLTLAIISLILVQKATDSEAVKKNFSIASKVLWGVVLINCFLAVATIFIAIFSLGIEGMGERMASALQRRYWLGTFVPTLMAAGINGVAAYFLGVIAGGKMTMMNTFKKINLGIAIGAIVLMVASSLFALHSTPSNTTSTSQNWDWILRGRGF